MKRIVDVDMEINCKKFETALNRFFKCYPELDNDWRETFKYMHEHNEEFECDNMWSDGSRNNNWNFALHLDEYEDHFYIAVILRE